MGFMRDRVNEARTAIEAGDQDRAVELIIPAALEGPSTRAECERSLQEGDDA
jgi:hypothetical protein